MTRDCSCIIIRSTDQLTIEIHFHHTDTSVWRLACWLDHDANIGHRVICKSSIDSMSNGSLIISCENDFLSRNIETETIANTRDQASLIICDILCTDLELESQTISLDRCLIEWSVVQRSFDILSNTQSHNALIALCAILRCAVGIFYKTIGWVVRSWDRESVASVSDGLVSISIWTRCHLHIEHELRGNLLDIEQRSLNLERCSLRVCTRCLGFQIDCHRSISSKAWDSLNIGVGLWSVCRSGLLDLSLSCCTLLDLNIDRGCVEGIGCKVESDILVLLNDSIFGLWEPSCSYDRESRWEIHTHDGRIEIVSDNSWADIDSVNSQRICSVSENLTEAVLRIDAHWVRVGIVDRCSTEFFPLIVEIDLNITEDALITRIVRETIHREALCRSSYGQDRRWSIVQSLLWLDRDINGSHIQVSRSWVIGIIIGDELELTRSCLSEITAQIKLEIESLAICWTCLIQAISLQNCRGISIIEFNGLDGIELLLTILSCHRTNGSFQDHLTSCFRIEWRLLRCESHDRSSRSTTATALNDELLFCTDRFSCLIDERCFQYIIFVRYCEISRKMLIRTTRRESILTVFLRIRFCLYLWSCASEVRPQRCLTEIRLNAIELLCFPLIIAYLIGDHETALFVVDTACLGERLDRCDRILKSIEISRGARSTESIDIDQSLSTCAESCEINPIVLVLEIRLSIISTDILIGFPRSLSNRESDLQTDRGIAVRIGCVDRTFEIVVTWDRHIVGHIVAVTDRCWSTELLPMRWVWPSTANPLPSLPTLITEESQNDTAHHITGSIWEIGDHCSHTIQSWRNCEVE